MASLSPARRRLRPRGPRSSPRGRPHAGPGAQAVALLTAGPRALPPGGRTACAEAHGRVPARPGEPRRPCRRAGAEGSGETPVPRRLTNWGPLGGLHWRPGRTCSACSEPLPGRRPLESGLRSPAARASHPGRRHAEPAWHGPRAKADFQAAPRSVRVAPTRQSGWPRDPRGLTAVTEVPASEGEGGAGGRGPGAGRAAGPALARSSAGRTVADAARALGRFVVTSRREGERTGDQELRCAETAVPGSRVAESANEPWRTR